MEKLKITWKKVFKNLELNFWEEISLQIFRKKKNIIFSEVIHTYSQCF